MRPETFLAAQVVVCAGSAAAAAFPVVRAARSARDVLAFDVLRAGVWAFCGAGALAVATRGIGLSAFGVIRGQPR